MDYLYIEKTVSELAGTLEKKRVNSVYLSNKKLSLGFGNLFLNCYLGNPNALFLSEEPIALEPSSHLNPIKGSYLKGISMPYPDRVVELSFVKILSPTQFEKYSLLLELTGKNANLFLLDRDGKVKFLLRPLLTSVREVEVKGEYSPPPLDKKPFDQLSFGQVTPEGIEKSLHKFALYISPLNAKEIAAIYTKIGDLEEAYRTFMENHSRSNSAYLYYREGKPLYLTTFPYESLKDLEFKEFKGKLPYSRAWEEFYKEKVLKGEVEALRERILKRLKKKRGVLIKELEELEGEELLKEAERSRLFGELLKVNLSSLKPGMESVTLYDYASGREVTVPLDPSLTPFKNMEAYFRAYKKLKRKAEISGLRRREIEEELAGIETLLGLVSSLEEGEKLKDFSREFSKGSKEKGKFSFKTFTLPSGRKIIVGRSAKENELISLKLSNPWDLWFHAKDTPGSHVILKLKRGEEPSREDLILTASAAAYFSKGRYSGKVPVDYTEVKNLKKPPKTPPGFLTYRGEKTLWVKPDLFEEFLKGEAPREGAGELTGKKR